MAIAARFWWSDGRAPACHQNSLGSRLARGTLGHARPSASLSSSAASRPPPRPSLSSSLATLAPRRPLARRLAIANFDDNIRAAVPLRFARAPRRPLARRLAFANFDDNIRAPVPLRFAQWGTTLRVVRGRRRAATLRADLLARYARSPPSHRPRCTGLCSGERA